MFGGWGSCCWSGGRARRCSNWGGEVGVAASAGWKREPGGTERGRASLARCWAGTGTCCGCVLSHERMPKCLGVACRMATELAVPPVNKTHISHPAAGSQLLPSPVDAAAATAACAATVLAVLACRCCQCNCSRQPSNASSLNTSPCGLLHALLYTCCHAAAAASSPCMAASGSSMHRYNGRL